MSPRRRLLVSQSKQNDGKGKTFLVGICLAVGLQSPTVRHNLRWWMSSLLGSVWLPPGDMEVLTTTATAILLGWMLFWLDSKKSQNDSVAAVTIYPLLGVQLSQGIMASTLQESGQLFLPRDTIADCIVYEVILSHKVLNVVAFRLKATSGDKLIPAFPGTDMTYEECFYMRQEIRKSLGMKDG